MAIYAYRCRGCGLSIDVPDYRAADFGDCPDCTGILKRDYSSIQLAPVMQEHFNPSVGKPISDRRKFDDELKRASEAAWERTGIPHNFVQVEGKDAQQAAGVTDDEVKAIKRMKARGESFDRVARTPDQLQEFSTVRKGELEKVQGVSARQARSAAPTH